MTRRSSVTAPPTTLCTRRGTSHQHHRRGTQRRIARSHRRQHCSNLDGFRTCTRLRRSAPRRRCTPQRDAFSTQSVAPSMRATPHCRARCSASPAQSRSSTPASLIGSPIKTSPEMAGFVNGSLIRCLDFNDDYFGTSASNAKGDTGPHPSDNIGSVLAAAEMVGASGSEAILAIVTAYEVCGRLVDEVVLRSNGWDHPILHSISTAVAAGKLMQPGPSSPWPTRSASRSCRTSACTRPGSVPSPTGRAWQAPTEARTGSSPRNSPALTSPVLTWLSKDGAGSCGNWTTLQARALRRTRQRLPDQSHLFQTAAAPIRDATPRPDGDRASKPRGPVNYPEDAGLHGAKVRHRTRARTRAVAADESRDRRSQWAVPHCGGTHRRGIERGVVRCRRGFSDPSLLALMDAIELVEDPTYTDAFPGRMSCRFEVELRDGNI